MLCEEFPILHLFTAYLMIISRAHNFSASSPANFYRHLVYNSPFSEIRTCSHRRQKVSEDKPVSIYEHNKSYFVTVQQGEKHYQLLTSKKLQDAKRSADQLKGKLKDLINLVRKYTILHKTIKFTMADIDD